MSIVQSDIKIYGCSLGVPENDTSPMGGSVDSSVRLNFDNNVLANVPATSGDGKLQYVGTNNADEGVTVTVYGRTPAGIIFSEEKDLSTSGVVVEGEDTFERIMRVVSEPHSYDVVIRDSVGNIIVNMESGVNEVVRPFYNITSNPDAARTFYSKGFISNTHNLLALLDVVVSESEDPEGNITFALGNVLDSDETTDNRLTAPTGVGSDGFSSDPKTFTDNFGDDNLEAGVNAPFYLKLDLEANHAATKTHYEITVDGQSI